MASTPAVREVAVGRGIRLMLASAALFALMTAAVKGASREIPLFQVVFARAAVGLALLVPTMGWAGSSFLGRGTRVLWIRAAAGTGALCLSFYAIGRLPLAMANLLGQTTPFFVALLSGPYLQEKVAPRVFGLIAVAFAGVALLLGPQADVPALGVAAALAAALLAALALTSIRRIGSREDPLTIIFYFTALAALVSGGLMLWQGPVWPRQDQMWLLVAGGVCAHFGQIALTRSFQAAPAAVISPFSYVGVLVSYLFGVSCFGERWTATALAGGALVVAAGIAVGRSAGKQ